jgi:hypothetical protein
MEGKKKKVKVDNYSSFDARSFELKLAGTWIAFYQHSTLGHMLQD